MKYLKLQDDLRISKLVLGTDYFGTTVSKETSYALMDTYLENGGNCLDTARMYANWLPNGEGASERVVGEWIKDRGVRDQVIISTKGGHPSQGNMSQGRLSRDCLEHDVDKSLKILGVDFIDLYWLHRDERSRPVSDIMETLHSFVRKGKVRAIGCSNWSVDRIKAANNFALANRLTPFICSQIQWSLATTSPEAHEDPTIVCMNDHEYQGYEEMNISVMAYSSQAKGFFAKGATLGLEGINQKAHSRFCTPENIERLNRVKQYAMEKGLTPTAVALGYILCNQVKSMAIIGCKTVDQLLDSLTAQEIEMSEETIQWLFGGQAHHE